MNNSFHTFKRVFPYIIASAFVLLGIYLVLTNPSDGINRDIGIANITFFSALILIGVTNKK